MRKTLFSILLSAAAIQSTFAGEPITLRDMGSFMSGDASWKFPASQ
jgi:hypothetical protein